MARPVRAEFVIPPGAQFGAQRAGGKRRHAGTDYHASPGTPVFATGDGVVEHIGYNGDEWLGLGHNITIRYGDRRETGGHLLESPTEHDIRRGERVNANTRIGSVGRTGNAVNADPRGPWNGNHLHQEIRKLNGLLVNPEVYYGGSAAPSSLPITPIEEEEDIMQLLYVYVGGGAPVGVIGTINRKFQPGEFPNFRNVWGTEEAPKNGAKIGQVVTEAGPAEALLNAHTGANMTPTAAQIAAEVKKVIPAGASVDVEKLANLIAERVKIPTKITGTLT